MMIDNGYGLLDGGAIYQESLIYQNLILSNIMKK